MSSQDSYKQINQEFMTILRELLATGDWEATLFLRTTSKKLQELYNQAEALSHYYDSLSPSKDYHKIRTEQGYTKVYVSLYQSDPYNLIKWQNTLKNIREYSINRPIYRQEEYVREMIRSKHESPNEGYVIIYIKNSDIIPPYAGKLVEDRWGHELLTLRDNSLSSENIIEFVHHGHRYYYHGGKVSLKPE
jgi:Dot/Icm secretion system protein IcmQ